MTKKLISNELKLNFENEFESPKPLYQALGRYINGLIIKNTNYVEDAIMSHCGREYHTLFIHLSHCDLDGVGCMTVMNYAMSLIGVNYMRDVTRLFANNPQSVNKVLREYLCDISELPNSTDVYYEFYILITDLHVDPKVLYKIQQNYERYKFFINWIVIDHHEDPEDYGSVIGNQYIKPIRFANGNINIITFGLYMCTQVSSNQVQLSATGILYVLLEKIFTKKKKLLIGHNNMTRLNDIYKIADYAYNVTLYDTGHWGHFDEPAINMEAPIAEQMYFQAYFDGTNFGDISKSPRYIQHRCAIIKNGNTYNIINNPHVIQKYAGLQDEYAKFANDVTVNSKPNALGTIGIKDNSGNVSGYMMYRVEGEDFANRNFTVATLYCSKPEDRYANFSIMSSRYLDENPNVDILSYVIEYNPSIELRTNKYDIDVGMIARYYGGGGHPKAAGFPITTK